MERERESERERERERERASLARNGSPQRRQAAGHHRALRARVFRQQREPTQQSIALLTGRFVPLALVILAPVILNIVLVHTFLDRTMPGPVIAYLLLAGGLFLAYYYRDAYRPLLRP